VSSVYLKEEAQYDMCSTFYKANLFLEHINHRLSDIDHIPYPDVLHMYHQAFRGFAELYDRVGYFEVEENLICMNQQGKVRFGSIKTCLRAYPSLSSLKLTPASQTCFAKSSMSYMRTLIL
jgi:hypothetical protein